MLFLLAEEYQQSGLEYLGREVFHNPEEAHRIKITGGFGRFWAGEGGFRFSDTITPTSEITNDLRWSGSNFEPYLGNASSYLFKSQTTIVANFLKDRTWLIMAPTQADISQGRCVVWSMRSMVFRDHGSIFLRGTINASPIYSNASFESLGYYVMASSYNQGSSREATGSARSSALPALSGSPGYGVASYAYDPAANTVTLIMSGAVSATSFHTFKIKSWDAGSAESFGQQCCFYGIGEAVCLEQYRD